MPSKDWKEDRRPGFVRKHHDSYWKGWKEKWQEKRGAKKDSQDGGAPVFNPNGSGQGSGSNQQPIFSSGSQNRSVGGSGGGNFGQTSYTGPSRITSQARATQSGLRNETSAEAAAAGGNGRGGFGRPPSTQRSPGLGFGNRNGAGEAAEHLRRGGMTGRGERVRGFEGDTVYASEPEDEGGNEVGDDGKGGGRGKGGDGKVPWHVGTEEFQAAQTRRN
ncbi:hypothetical protein CC80DRAFT_537877 [Byssothecium circinans]|uniref:Uncharacterized protein n=1 Tax=Byssothecium circinans TaxID=147558 RepID=A0A6A5TKE8_9PLEO|nr:hypothetical protein CC80DRAFT_537877 [Byssothecium circinans]